MPRGVKADLTGQRFGNWTVVGCAGVLPTRVVVWNTRCDCGRRGTVPTSNLTGGKSQRCRSCGNSREHSARWNNKGE